MGLGRVHTCASVLIGLLRSPSEHPPLATAALADPQEPQWAPPPTIAALADPWEPQWAPPLTIAALCRLLGAPVGIPPPATAALANPGFGSSAQDSPTTHRHLQDSWICLPFHLGSAFFFMGTSLCTPGRVRPGGMALSLGSSPKSGGCPWGQAQALQRMHLPLWVPVVLGGLHVRPLRGQRLCPRFRVL